MGIGLVAHIPDQTIVGRVEHVMQSDGQFDGAQVGAQVAAGARDTIEHEGAQFIGDLGQLPARQTTQVRGVRD